MSWRKIIALTLVTILCAGITLIGVGQNNQEAPILNIYHWWTSGSEKAAINALIDVYLGENPDVTVWYKARFLAVAE